MVVGVDVTAVDVTVVVHHERHRDGVVAVLLGACWACLQVCAPAAQVRVILPWLQ